MKKNEDVGINFCVSGIIGIRNDIKRLLLTKGMSPINVDKIIDKIEIIIGLSGELGKILQREKDMDELRKMQLELHETRSKGMVY